MKLRGLHSFAAMETMSFDWTLLLSALTSLGFCVFCVYILVTDAGVHPKWLVIVAAVISGILGVLFAIGSVRVKRRRSGSSTK